MDPAKKNLPFVKVILLVQKINHIYALIKHVQVQNPNVKKIMKNALREVLCYVPMEIAFLVFSIAKIVDVLHGILIIAY
jgi:hypothetical protein